MKNAFKLVTILAISLTCSSAFSQGVAQGSMDAYGGLSFIYPKAKNFVLGVDYKAKAPMYFLGIDFGLTEQFSFGIQFTKSNFHGDDVRMDPTNPGAVASTEAIDLTMTGFYGVGKWFVPLKLKGLKPYVSLQPQFFVYSYKAVTTSNTGQTGDPYRKSTGKVYMGVYAGTRYAFSERFSAFGELGIGGWSTLNLGVNFQFKQ